VRTNFQSLAATAILLYATIAAPGIASAAAPGAHIVRESAGDAALSMTPRDWSDQGALPNETWADLLSANMQVAADNYGDVIAGHPVMLIQDATDLSPANGAESAPLSSLDLVTSKAARRLVELGYQDPGAPLPQSVSWALMIGGIGFAAALFRLSSTQAKASST
jgi:hypothetical protein